jgi:hypothetical protein
MEDITIKNIFVSSQNRNTSLYPYGNSYTLFLNTAIKQVKKVELVNASVPNTLYNVSNGSNVISVGNAGAVGGLLTFSIPNGFYSAPGLASELVFALGNATGINVQYVSNEGKMLFTNTSVFNMVINSAELAPLLGFPASVVGQVLSTSFVSSSPGSQVYPLYSDNTQYRGLNWIKSTQVVTMVPIDGIFLDIQELRNFNNEDAQAMTNQTPSSFQTYSGSNTSRTFGMIPLDVSSGNIKMFKKNTDYDLNVEFPYPIQKIDRLTIQWTDVNGNVVSFNGLEDNSFLLRFHIINLK